MFRCRKCGEDIDAVQYRDFGLCPACVREQRASAPLQKIAKGEATDKLWGAVLGIIICASATLVLFMGFIFGDPTDPDNMFGLLAPLFAVFGYVIGGGIMIASYLMYKGSL